MKCWGILLFVGALLLAGCGAPAPSATLPVPTQPEPVPATVTSAPSPSPSLTPLPEPTPTATPAVIAGAECLPGVWELSGAEEFFRGSLAAQGSPLSFVAASGDLIYEFGAGGRVTIRFEDFTVESETSREGQAIPLRTELTGEAQAAYTAADDRRLVLSQFGGDDVTLTVSIAGQTILRSALPAWQSFFQALSLTGGEELAPQAAPDQAVLTYTCRGDELTLESAGVPVAMPFRRSP